MKNYVILKLIGLVILTMAILVLFSILEVAFYSYVVNPGHPVSVYDKHAELTAPYVSGILGFIIFFLVARFWKKRNYDNLTKLVFLFPLIYVLVDITIITVAGVKWSDYILIFSLANTAKFLGSMAGYKLS
jgi:hypothetical protein